MPRTAVKNIPGRKLTIVQPGLQINSLPPRGPLTPVRLQVPRGPECNSEKIPNTESLPAALRHSQIFLRGESSARKTWRQKIGHSTRVNHGDVFSFSEFLLLLAGFMFLCCSVDKCFFYDCDSVERLVRNLSRLVVWKKFLFLRVFELNIFVIHYVKCRVVSFRDFSVLTIG